MLNLALGAGVLVLGALAAYLAGRSSEEAAPKLTSMAVSEVNTIRIQREAHPDITLERRGEHWYLTAPYEIAASDFRARRVARLAVETSLKRYPAEELDLARYGLAPPRVRVFLNDTELGFGDNNPVTHQRYVLAGGQVHLVADTVFDVLNAEVASFLGPRLLPEDAVVTGIALPEVTLNKQDTEWVLDPERPELSADDIRAFVDGWTRAEALWAKPRSQRPAQGEVRITLADGHELRFQIIETDPDLVLARPDLEVEYTLSGTQAERLLKISPQPEDEDAEASGG